MTVCWVSVDKNRGKCKCTLKAFKCVRRTWSPCKWLILLCKGQNHLWAILNEFVQKFANIKRNIRDCRWIVQMFTYLEVFAPLLDALRYLMVILRIQGIPLGCDQNYTFWVWHRHHILVVVIELGEHACGISRCIAMSPRLCFGPSFLSLLQLYAKMSESPDTLLVATRKSGCKSTLELTLWTLSHTSLRQLHLRS